MPSDAVPDRWMVVEVDRPTEEWRRDLLIEAISELTGRGAEEDDDVIRGYLPFPKEPTSATVSAVSSALDPLLPPGASGVTYRWQPHEDWVELWRAGVRARHVTPRLVVSPTWDPYEAAGDEILLHLDPGVAFGTAEHPTTRGCLRLLEKYVGAGERIGDFGCGSGILSIAAAKLGADHVLAIDSDPFARGATLENVRLNGVTDRVSVRLGLVDAEFLKGQDLFDGIAANIEAGVLEPLLSGLRTALSKGGWLILSGIQTHESSALVAAAAAAGLALLEGDEESGWWTGAFSGS